MQIRDQAAYKLYVDTNKGTPAEGIVGIATNWADRMESVIKGLTSAYSCSPSTIIIQHFYECFVASTATHYSNDPRLYKNAKKVLEDCWEYGDTLRLLP